VIVPSRTAARKGCRVAADHSESSTPRRIVTLTTYVGITKYSAPGRRRADGPFEALCRLYGPKKLFFDKTWKLPDITKV